MKIHFTEHAEENLTTIYAYQYEYARDFAESFNDEIVGFIISNLTNHPKLGHVYNQAQNLYRIIYKQRYNVYYLIQDNTNFILYILDGRLLLNEELVEADVTLPPVK